MIHIAKHLLLVGCGKMGGALLSGWEAKRLIERIDIIEPQVSGNHQSFASLDELPADAAPSIILFAVKPQMLEAVLPSYKQRFGATPLYLTIAAGKELSYYKEHLGNDARIIRAMPNTPALIGKGMTALTANANASAQDKQTAQALFDAVGKTFWLSDESQMHAVTALSGSGPAYAFLFIEALAQAGIAAGLDAEVARTSACETLLGSAMLAEESGETLEQLRINVTSPGGTTAAALEVLMKEDRFASLVKEAVAAAARRSRELAEKG